MLKKRILKLIRIGMFGALGLGNAMGDGPMVPPGLPPVQPAKLCDVSDYAQIKNVEAATFLYLHGIMHAEKVDDAFCFCPDKPADLEALVENARKLLPLFSYSSSSMTRDEAAAALYLSMQQQGLILLTDGFSCSSYTIPAYSVVMAPPGKGVTMTVDNVETKMEAGKSYTGNIVVTVSDAFEITHMFDLYEARTALCYDNGIQNAKSVPSAIISGAISGSSAENVTIRSENDYFNPITISGGHYRLVNPTIQMNGHGGDDFAGYGAGIMVTGDAEVEISGGTIDTTGSIRTAIWLGGHCKALISDVTITGHDGNTTDFPVSVMNEVPWPLGLKGNLRTTNLLEWAEGTYLNCNVQCENWGVMSTDGSWKGSKLTLINTDVTITGESGYGVYCDMGVEDFIYGSTLNVADYGLIIGGVFCGATFGSATPENVGALYTRLPDARKDAPTVVHSKKNAIMIHSNEGGHCTIGKDTELHSSKTAIVVKSMPGKNVTTQICADGAKIISDSGILLHLMEGDDAGNPGSKGWEVPEVQPVKTALDTTDENEAETLHTSFSNMVLRGDIYNSRWLDGQNLCVHLCNCNICGNISAVRQWHVNVPAGEFITKQTYYEVGNVAVEPAPVISNGVIVELSENSVWTPTETSYLSKLIIAGSARVCGSLTIDGVETPLESGKTYTGNLVVSKI